MLRLHIIGVNCAKSPDSLFNNAQFWIVEIYIEMRNRVNNHLTLVFCKGDNGTKKKYPNQYTSHL